jgi:hypothetical protein
MEISMEIINIGSGQLNDRITGELSYMAVRVADNSIGIVLSQESSGEAEIFIDVDNCKLLIEWLNTAIIKAKNFDSS